MPSLWTMSPVIPGCSSNRLSSALSTPSVVCSTGARGMQRRASARPVATPLHSVVRNPDYFGTCRAARPEPDMAMAQADQVLNA